MLIGPRMAPIAITGPWWPTLQNCLFVIGEIHPWPPWNYYHPMMGLPFNQLSTIMGLYWSWLTGPRMIQSCSAFSDWWDSSFAPMAELPSDDDGPCIKVSENMLQMGHVSHPVATPARSVRMPKALFLNSALLCFLPLILLGYYVFGQLFSMFDSYSFHSAPRLPH